MITMSDQQPPKPAPEENEVFDFRGDEEEFEEDEDERDNQQLETTWLQKLLSPMYLLILLVWMGIACVPLLILYTVGWMAWQAGK